jgi:UDP-N-acetylglucosamine 2-epimerase (non-hydrolysing)
LGKPVLVLREVTERPEGIDAGTAMLVGTDRRSIEAKTRELLTRETAYGQMAHKKNPYGDGRASGRIVDKLNERFG